jgi:histidine ammonia-lyase
MDALELRRPFTSGKRLEKILKSLRLELPASKGDRVLSPEIENAARVIEQGLLANP